MTQKIKLSVVSITYNQEPFVRDAIEGFLKQRVNFPWEIIIADDSSTDKTAEIIKEYAEKNPDLIKPILRNKNVGVLDNLYDALRAAKGEYIAICEGDDYWTDENKLQRQVDFLEQNSEYSLCFHPVKVVYQNKEKKDSTYPDPDKKRTFDTLELLKNNFIQTNSVVYRKQNYDNLPENIMPIDWYLHLYHAQFGKIGFIDKTMSVYRRHPGGIWWDSYEDKDEFWRKYGQAHLNVYSELMKLYSNNIEYRKIIEKSVSDATRSIIQSDTSTDRELVKSALLRFPDNSAKFLSEQQAQLKDQYISIEKQTKDIEKLKNELYKKDKIIKQISGELKLIKLSRFWKLRNFLVKFIGKQPV